MKGRRGGEGSKQRTMTKVLRENRVPKRDSRKLVSVVSR